MSGTPKVVGRRHIGFFGCGNANRLVSVRPPRGMTGTALDLRKLKLSSWRIEPCAACGGRHYTKPLWRPVRSESERGEHQLVKADRVSDGMRKARENTAKRHSTSRSKT